jgi:uncharacterized protein (DUF1697 family)
MKHYVAFLRGINVGENKKISMKELAALFEQAGFKNIKTILNSGNVVFEAKETSEIVLIKKIEKAISDKSGFAVRVQIRKLDDINKMIGKNPFKQYKPDKNFHWYVTFLNGFKGKLPAATGDSYNILCIENDALFIIMDRTKGQSTNLMTFLDKSFGKKVTTRNWNTIVKIAGAKA